jgi:hypothetical protein
MTHDELAILRSLAARPSRKILPSLQTVVDDLQRAGYITCNSDGWIATAEGCNAIEREHAALSQPRNQT